MEHKTFGDYVVEHGSLSSLLIQYGHQKSFWQRLDYFLVQKGLEIDHYSGYFKKCPYKMSWVKSENTGKHYIQYD